MWKTVSVCRDGRTPPPVHRRRRCSIVNAELAKDVVKMLFHCLLGAGQDLANFPVRFAFGDPLQDFLLPRGQSMGVCSLWAGSGIDGG